MTKQEKKDYQILNESERKIYDSIMQSFPMTDRGAAFDKAIEGGCSFQFVFK